MSSVTVLDAHRRARRIRILAAMRRHPSWRARLQTAARPTAPGARAASNPTTVAVGRGAVGTAERGAGGYGEEPPAPLNARPAGGDS